MFFLSLLGVLTVALAILAVMAMSLPPVQLTPAERGTERRFDVPFRLVGQDGEALTEQSFLGKPSLYFFGFTHCPDICPTTLGALTQWLNALGDDAKRFNVLFVSVDPERDTPASLKDYMTMFHPQMRAATGTPEEIAAMAKTFMVYYAKVPVKAGEDPKEYMVNHSSMILLADAKGVFKGTLDAHDPDEKAIGKLKALLNGQ